MLSMRLLSMGARVIGADGAMNCFNFVAPQYGSSLTIRTKQGKRKVRVDKQPPSYQAQLHAFANAVQQGAPFPTDVDDSIANMRVIDAVSQAAGMKVREPSFTY